MEIPSPVAVQRNISSLLFGRQRPHRFEKSHFPKPIEGSMNASALNSDRACAAHRIALDHLGLTWINAVSVIPRDTSLIECRRVS